jgi:hypothetical protein
MPEMHSHLLLAIATLGSWTAPQLTVDVLSVGSMTVGLGETFSVPVTIVSGSSDLYAFQFDVAYDPTILQLLSIEEGASSSTAGSTLFIPGTIDNALGSATLNAETLLGPVPGAAGSGTLATFDFQAIEAGTSAVSISNVILLDSNLHVVAFTNTDGRVMVSAETVPEAEFWHFLGCGHGVAGGFWLRATETQSLNADPLK